MGCVILLNKMLNETRLIERALNASWQREAAIAQNIANVNTPNYKRKTVAFEEFLDLAEQRDFKTPRTVIPRYKDRQKDYDIVTSTDNANYSMRLDGNNVDIEREMAENAKNEIKASVLYQSLHSKFKLMKTAIKEGKV